MTSTQKRPSALHILSTLILASLMVSCSQPLQTLTQISPGITPQTRSAVKPPTPAPETEITFRVEIPEDTPTEDSISLNILDEVTGLALNPLTYPMDVEDDTHLSITLRFPIGSVIKYRYSRHGENTTLLEYTTDGRPVRYRLYLVEGPGTVQDVVARWTDTDYQDATGRISGQALDAFTGQPIPNLLIEAGGVQSITTADGSYLLEGLPPATQNLVAYAMDGSYRPFQQGAQVAVNSTTPAELRLQPAKFVNVTFDVNVPDNTIPAVPIRIAGNLYQLGNTFADLTGGVSTLATRMPTLDLESEHEYRLSMSLPAGADIRYTYTIGDGFWNTELTNSGESEIRQFIVPNSDTIVQDTVESWRPQDSAPITFDVTVPADTPPEDTISIQFNPFYGWTEPIPMWHIGKNRWAYVLNGPVGVISNISYRYCRNNQCGSADASDTMGPDASGHPVNPGSKVQSIKETIQSWAWLNPTATLGTIDEVPVQPRGGNFMAGVELQPSFHPSWTPLMPLTLDAIQSMGANWTILTPTWTFTQNQPPMLEPVPGQDILLSDLSELTTRALARGQNVALLPTPQFPERTDDWWASAPLDYPWWVSWFERYRSFVLNFADQATRSGVHTLILGGSWLEPAVPGGTLSDGTSSGVPDDAEARWRSLLQEVRSRYHGTLAWALSDAQAAKNPPAFLDAVDLIYLQFSAPLADTSSPDQASLAAAAGRLLDEQIQPLQAKLGKPVILTAAYPSVDGASSACIRINTDEPCLELNALARPQPDITSLSIDLQEQADIYSALLKAVNDRPWINGFVTAGFYPPAQLQDKSASVHGKPAEQILSYWYPRLLAPAQ